MRRRLVLAIAAVAAASIVLFALPLAFLIRRSYRDAELLRLQRDAVAATRQIDIAATSADAVELPDSTDTMAVYGRDGRRRAGQGPARADAVVRSAFAQLHPTDAAGAGTLVAAVPLVAGERVTGVVRVSRDAAAVDGRVHRAWLLLAALAAGVLAVAVGAAAVVGRRLARPLERLAGAAARLGDGDFTISTPPSGVGEVDAVAASLETTARRLGESLARERTFSADASHQLRTPLAALRLEIESMQLRPDAPAEVPLALEQVVRLQGTIDTLLSVARGAPPPRGELDLTAVIAELEDRFHSPLADAARPLRIDMPAPAPAVTASGNVVREILAVLLDNALVHGAGAVSVVVRHASSGWVVIEVGDEGPGIPGGGDDPFARRQGSGHGIGLALARSLADAEGARLSLSRAGPRPVFALFLPQPEPVAED